MDAETMKLLGIQNCTVKMHNDLLEVMNMSRSDYEMARKAFEYGRIIGKRVERERRRSKQVQVEPLVSDIPINELKHISQNSETQGDAFITAYCLGWENAVKKITAPDGNPKAVLGGVTQN